jgi:type IV pilus assembly protein PilE
MKHAKGFTLIELMITVVILGILSMIAMPAYTNYVIRGKIPDATSNLATKRVQMEQYFQDNRRYNTVTLGALCGVNSVADNTSSRYFTFTCTTPSDSSFTLTATGTGSMAGFVYTINESNTKTSTLTAGGDWTANSATCWITKQGGGC